MLFTGSRDDTPDYEEASQVLTPDTLGVNHSSAKLQSDEDESPSTSPAQPFVIEDAPPNLILKQFKELLLEKVSIGDNQQKCRMSQFTRVRAISLAEALARRTRDPVTTTRKADRRVDTASPLLSQNQGITGQGGVLHSGTSSRGRGNYRSLGAPFRHRNGQPYMDKTLLGRRA